MMHLDHLVINSTNVERATHFYSELLDCPVERWDQFVNGSVKFPSLRISETFIIDVFPPDMWRTEEQRSTRPNINHFCLATTPEHWQKVVEFVASQNITVEKGPAEFWGARGNGISIFIKDPDGNVVEVRKYA